MCFFQRPPAFTRRYGLKYNAQFEISQRRRCTRIHVTHWGQWRFSYFLDWATVFVVVLYHNYANNVWERLATDEKASGLVRRFSLQSFMPYMLLQADTGLPKPLRIPQLPQIDWSQYVSQFGTFDQVFSNSAFPSPSKPLTRRKKISFVSGVPSKSAVSWTLLILMLRFCWSSWRFYWKWQPLIFLNRSFVFCRYYED